MHTSGTDNPVCRVYPYHGQVRLAGSGIEVASSGGSSHAPGEHLTHAGEQHGMPPEAMTTLPTNPCGTFLTVRRRRFGKGVPYGHPAAASSEWWGALRCAERYSLYTYAKKRSTPWMTNVVRSEGKISKACCAPGISA